MQKNFESYIGSKIIRAKKMDECSFLKNIKKENIDNRETREGYMVLYPGGYKSWSPKEVFEAAAYEMTKHGKPKEVLGSAPTAVLQEPVVTRASILDNAKNYVTKDRAAQHGNMEDNFTNIEAGWSWWDSIKPDDLPSGIDMAVKMTLVKIGRIASNPKHIDNWEDGCGYLACGGELAGKDV